jgi:transcriptional regulator with XRE-family HTH domain
MGSARRIKPAKLGMKLLLVRKKLDLTLSEMAAQLSNEHIILRKQDISRFEKGQREPTLITILAYARLVHIPIETFADDKLDLPDTF